MKRYKTLAGILNLVPGAKILGIYRFLPIFFGLGAALEFSMINWHAGQANFYQTFKKRRAHELAVQKLGITE